MKTVPRRFNEQASRVEGMPSRIFDGHTNRHIVRPLGEELEEIREIRGVHGGVSITAVLLYC